jgi:hypothetical protein
MTYGVEWTPSVAVFGFVALLFVPYLSLIVLGVLLLAATAAVAALAGAVVSAPYLLRRSVLRRRHAPPSTPLTRDTTESSRPPLSSRLCSRTIEARSLGTNDLPDPTLGLHS